MFFIIITLDFLKRIQEPYLYFFMKLRLNKKKIFNLNKSLIKKKTRRKN